MKTTLSLFILAFVLVSCSKGYPELGDGYRIHGEGGYMTQVVNSQNTVLISEYILDYKVNSTFILIAQSHPDSLQKMKTLVYSDYDRKLIADNKNVYRQYWIINKKQKNIHSSFDSRIHRNRYSNVYGPYDKAMYRIVRDSLNVQLNLKLMDE